MDVVIATGNKGKVKEFKKLLKGCFDKVYSAAELGIPTDVEETGGTFAENSLIKARHVKALTSMAALADDSGLMVDCLDGAPGVYSARYAGENADDQSNRKKLFSEMRGAADRSARFVCALTLILPDGEIITADGETKGHITESEEGSNGFGYDVMFFSDELGKSFGMADDVEKNSVSHRAKAAAALAEKLKNLRK